MTLLQSAIARHQQGELEIARALYQRVIDLDRADMAARYGLVQLLRQQQNNQEALNNINAAISAAPRDPRLIQLKATILREAGQYLEALSTLSALIKQYPEDPNLLIEQALNHQALNSINKAILAYTAALQLAPDHHQALVNRAFLFERCGDIDAAINDSAAVLDYLDQRIKKNPADLEAVLMRGNSLRWTKRYDEAIACYDQILAAQPENPAVLSNRGNVNQQRGHYAEAVEDYIKALAYAPKDSNLWSQLGLALCNAGEPETALQKHCHALECEPNVSSLWVNASLALQQLNRWPEALEHLERALQLDPTNADAWSNYGLTLQNIGEFPAALEAHDQCLKLQPKHTVGTLNAALAHLQAGNFSRGWPLYEARWCTQPRTRFQSTVKQPPWLGREPVAGRTILLHAEQGLGDTLQFCRYVPVLADMGARVALQVQKPLVGLLRNLTGTAQIVSDEEPSPEFDLHCPLLSLPLAMGATALSAPTIHPYLVASPQRVKQWEKRLGPKSAARIGLVWSGSSIHKNDRNRSLPLARLLAALPQGYEYISLQKEIRESDAPALASNLLGLRFFGDDLQSFEDTAALCTLVDLVISVDTSVAHLAGGLGINTWLMLPFNPDFRWMVKRDDSPWYPTFTLVRQPEPGDWDSVVAVIANALSQGNV